MVQLYTVSKIKHELVNRESISLESGFFEF